MTVSNIDKARELAEQPCAWPGGYPLFAVMEDSGCLCAKCCEQEMPTILQADGDRQWTVAAIEVNWESDLYCDHCSNPIEKAYE